MAERGKKYHFLKEDVAQELDRMTDRFLHGDSTAEDLLNLVKEKLPVHKTDQSTWKMRVEGMYEVSERLFESVFRKGRDKYGESWDRKKVVVEGKIRPFSYYHWLTGSREPASNVMTRDDYLNDPTTAMRKLEDDILALGLLYKRLEKE